MMTENEAKLNNIKKWVIEILNDAARWNCDAQTWNDTKGTRYYHTDSDLSTMDCVVNDIMDLVKEYGEFCKKTT
jgi:hypothetical protein